MRAEPPFAIAWCPRRHRRAGVGAAPEHRGVPSSTPPDDSLPPWLLPKPRKALLYLDQGPLSDLAKILDPESPRHERARKDAFLVDVGLRIERLVKLQVLICPMSFFHHAESLLSEDPSYATLHYVGEYLSDGCTFTEKEAIIAWQIARAYEAHRTGGSATPIERASLMNTGHVDEWMQPWEIVAAPRPMRGEHDIARRAREARQQRMATEFARWQATPPRPVGEAAASEFEALRSALESALRCHRAMRRAADGDLTCLDEALDKRAVDVQELLRWVLPNHSAAPTEAEARYDDVLAFLRSPALLDVPFFALRTVLWPALAWKRHHGMKKEPPSIGTDTDINIVAALLPYCDAMLLDVEMATLLREDPTLKELVASYGTRVFSRRDRADIVTYLSELERAATPEHMELLGRVYRDLGTWLMPYTGVVLARRGRPP